MEIEGLLQRLVVTFGLCSGATPAMSKLVHCQRKEWRGFHYKFHALKFEVLSVRGLARPSCQNNPGHVVKRSTVRVAALVND